ISVLEYREENRIDFDLGMLGGVKLDYENGVFRRYHVGANPVNFTDPSGLINWSRVGWGALEATGGTIGIAVAAKTEVATMGAGTVLAVGLATMAVPALSHGVTEVIAGFADTNAKIPPVSGPALGALLVTGNVNAAEKADLAASLLFFGKTLVTAGKSSSTLEGVGAAVDFINAGRGLSNSSCKK
ncbi:MAG: hypothetical protein AB1553_16345, partial [Nitrospirota bacterium]